MNGADVRAVLIAPVFLYVAAVGFADFGAWSPLIVLVVAAMALPVLEFLLPQLSGRSFAPAGFLAGVTGLGLTISNGAPSGAWAAIGAGVLLGTPLTALFGLMLWRRSRLAFILGVEAGLAVLIVLLATIEDLPLLGLSPSASSIIVSFSSVNSQQFVALLAWVQGNPMSVTPPLAAVSDPYFIAFAVLAALSVVLTLLERPSYAGHGPEPWDPHLSRSSGVVPLVVAAFAGLTFEWTAAADPRFALLAVAVGVAATLALVGAVVAYMSRRRDVPVAPA